MKYFIKKNGTFLSASYDTTKDVVERIVADMQSKEPDAKFEMLEWDGWLNMKVLEKLQETGCLNKINWNWDKKYIPRRKVKDDDVDWDIT